MLMQYFHSMKNVRIMFPFHLEQRAVCCTNSSVLCEDIVPTYYPEMHGVTSAPNAHRHPAILQAQVASAVQPPWHGCSIQSPSHWKNIYVMYARCSGHMMSKTGKALVLMQINLIRERDIKQLITHMNIDLQIALRKSWCYKGYIRRPSWAQEGFTEWVWCGLKTEEVSTKHAKRLRTGS